MVSVQDVVQLVAHRGAASLGELEQDVEAADWDGLEFLAALDACVDHGYLRLALRRDQRVEAPYRVTRRGHRLLQAAARATAAA